MKEFKTASIILIIIVFSTLAFVFPKQASTQAVIITTIDKSISEMTIPELQAKIAEILSAIQQLQTLIAQLTGGTDISGIPSGFTFQNNLGYGQSSIDIKYLQIFLNADPDTQLSATGAGSSGQETSYFGTGTKEAVIAFQTKYKDEISAAIGYTISYTGYVGSGTRTKLNALLAVVGEQGEQEEEEEEEEEEKPTLHVDLKASLFSRNWQDLLTGTVSLSNVDLRAIVTGTATGTVNYMFDCENDGIWDSPDTFYFKGVTTTLKDFVNQCNYPNLGTYTAKVKVERDTASPAEDTVTIIINPPVLQCGDGECNGIETCLTCPRDCGYCLSRNNPPTLATIGNKSIDENQKLIFIVSAVDPENDTLYYSIQDRPIGATFSDRIFTWTPSYEESGTYNVTFIVSDAELIDKETITITVLEYTP